MKLFQIILVLSSFFVLTNCVGVSPQKVDIDKIKKERKLPKPDFFIPDAQYVTTGNGDTWDLRHFMDFRFWSPPFFNSKETKQHKSAVYMALEHVKDFEFFIKELERISPRGYIELPSRFSDNLVFENKEDHIWWFKFDDYKNQIIASKKNQLIDPFITVSISKIFLLYTTDAPAE